MSSSRRFYSFVALALLAGWIAACGGKEEAGGAGAERGESGSADALPDAAKGTASIKGTIKAAAPPQDDVVQAADMSATDPYCAKAHSGAVQLQEVVVGGGGEVADVFVYVKEGAPASKAPTEEAVLDQSGCLYAPKVLGLQVGQTLHVKTSDETPHNVNCKPKKGRGFNRAFPNKESTYNHKFTVAEAMVQVKCDIHPWMSGHIGVSANPFFAVSGKDGTFEIKNLPAGTYTIEAVHAKLGSKTQQVTVADGEAKTGVDLSF